MELSRMLCAARRGRAYTIAGRYRQAQSSRPVAQSLGRASTWARTAAGQDIGTGFLGAGSKPVLLVEQCRGQEMSEMCVCRRFSVMVTRRFAAMKECGCVSALPVTMQKFACALPFSARTEVGFRVARDCANREEPQSGALPT
jgi:hypothetical protein